MKKVPIIYQDDKQSCGISVMAMILKYYGINIDLHYLKTNAKLNTNGVSVYTICRILKQYHLEANAFNASVSDVEIHMKSPCIVHFNYSDGRSHYVVLYKIDKDYFYIANPDSGYEKIKENDFNELFSGVVIFIEKMESFTKFNQTNQYLNVIKSLFVTNKMALINISFIALLIMLINLFISQQLRIITDELLITFDQKGLFYLSILISSFYIVKHLLDYISQKMIVKLKQQIDRSIILKGYQRLLLLPQRFYDYAFSGELLAKFQALNITKEFIVNSIELIFLDTFIVLMIVFLIANISITLAYIFSLMLIIYVILNALFTMYYDKNYKQLLIIQTKIQKQVLEIINNIKAIKFSLNEKKYNQNIISNYEEILDKEYEISKYSSIHHSSINLLFSLFYCYLIYFGFSLVFKQELSIGQMISFTVVISYINQPLNHLFNVIQQYKQAKNSFYRIQEVLDYQIVIKDYNQDINLGKIEKIVFNQVSFGYIDGINILNNFDIVLDKSIVITGKSGSCKSTIVKLIMKLYDDYDGMISVNDNDLKAIDSKLLYSKISYVGDDTGLFNDSVINNIIMYDRQKLIKLEQIIKEIEIDNFLNLNGVVEEKGANLSQGQKQLINLLRVLVNDFDVLILDEATSHLDINLAKMIWDYIILNYKEKKILAISHDSKVISLFKYQFNSETLELITKRSGKIK